MISVSVSAWGPSPVRARDDGPGLLLLVPAGEGRGDDGGRGPAHGGGGAPLLGGEGGGDSGGPDHGEEGVLLPAGGGQALVVHGGGPEHGGGGDGDQGLPGSRVELQGLELPPEERDRVCVSLVEVFCPGASLH